MKTHQHIRLAEGLPSIAWSEHKTLRGVSKGARVIDCIDVAYSRLHKARLQADDLVAADGLFENDLLVDISQDASRKPSTEGQLRALCGGSTLYSMKLDRQLLAMEHLMCLGWGRASLKLSELSENQIRDLAGESMAPPAIGLVVTSLGLTLGGDIWAD